jgi:hypothetical protein
MSEEDLVLLDVVFERVRALLELSENVQFIWLGSGLQKHYGHITVAKQDCYGSVDDAVSAKWYAIYFLFNNHFVQVSNYLFISERN